MPPPLPAPSSAAVVSGRCQRPLSAAVVSGTVVSVRTADPDRFPRPPPVVRDIHNDQATRTPVTAKHSTPARWPPVETAIVTALPLAAAKLTVVVQAGQASNDPACATGGNGLHDGLAAGTSAQRRFRSPIPQSLSLTRARPRPPPTRVTPSQDFGLTSCPHRHPSDEFGAGTCSGDRCVRGAGAAVSAASSAARALKIRDTLPAMSGWAGLGSSAHRTLIGQVVAHYQHDSRVRAVAVFGSVSAGSWHVHVDLYKFRIDQHERSSEGRLGCHAISALAGTGHDRCTATVAAAPAGVDQAR